MHLCSIVQWIYSILKVQAFDVEYFVNAAIFLHPNLC